MSFLDPAIAVTLIDVVEEGGRRERPRRRPRRPRRSSQRGVERAAELGRNVDCTRRPGRGRPGDRPRRRRGKFDAIFMSLRGVYRRGDTTAFASNTRYVLENAPCRVILGFAPKSIPAPTSNGLG